jgi:hypothetical protein
LPEKREKKKKQFFFFLNLGHKIEKSFSLFSYQTAKFFFFSFFVKKIFMEEAEKAI